MKAAPENEKTKGNTSDSINWRDRKGKEKENSPRNENSNRDEHPYKNVTPIEFVPIGSSNAASPSSNVSNSKTQKKSKEIGDEEEIVILDDKPRYSNKAPIAQKSKVDSVLSKVLGAPITLTAEDVLNVSDSTREELRKLISKKRFPRKAAMFEEVLPIDDDETEEDALPFRELNGPVEKSITLEADAIYVGDLPMAEVFLNREMERSGLPPDAIVIDDPVLQYLNNLSEGETPKQIYVAKESQSLRSVYPLVNGVYQEEAVYDNGSQLVSMDEQEAISAGLIWDPSVTVLLQSANKQVEPSLGLARNVPFLFDDVTIYLQVHIVRNAAYRILLGRPFDTLTESEVRNSKDGGQTITITDPNTKRKRTIPTFERGKAPRTLNKNKAATVENFHNSRI